MARAMLRGNPNTFAINALGAFLARWHEFFTLQVFLAPSLSNVRARFLGLNNTHRKLL